MNRLARTITWILVTIQNIGYFIIDHPVASAIIICAVIGIIIGIISWWKNR